MNIVRRVAEQIVNTGHVERGFLGVSPQLLTPGLAAQFGIDHGALTADVTPGSPADKAGLQAGDVITKVNGKEVRDPRHLLLTISSLEPGTTVTLDVLRNGQPLTLHATLANRPGERPASEQPTGTPNTPGSQQGVLNGVTGGDLTPDLRDQLQIPSRVQGAVVTNVDPDSASAQQGLREGDVIESLDRKPVKNAEEAVRLSSEIKGPKVLVRFWRGGHNEFVVIDESQK